MAAILKRRPLWKFQRLNVSPLSDALFMCEVWLSSVHPFKRNRADKFRTKINNNDNNNNNKVYCTVLGCENKSDSHERPFWKRGHFEICKTWMHPYRGPSMHVGSLTDIGPFKSVKSCKKFIIIKSGCYFEIAAVSKILRLECTPFGNILYMCEVWKKKNFPNLRNCIK